MALNARDDEAYEMVFGPAIQSTDGDLLDQDEDLVPENFQTIEHLVATRAVAVNPTGR